MSKNINDSDLTMNNITDNRRISTDSFNSACSMPGSETEHELLYPKDEEGRTKHTPSTTDKKTTSNKAKINSRKPRIKTQKNVVTSGPSKSNDDQVLSMLLDIKNNQCTKHDMANIVSKIDGKFESIESELASQNSRFSDMELKLKHFEKKISSANYDGELQKQQQLKNNITIMGIPASVQNDVWSTAIDVFNAFGCNYVASDFTAVYRSSGKLPKFSSIIVKFANFDKKLLALNSKAKKPVQLKDVPSLNINQVTPIYLNNHVTPFFGRLLAAGRTASKEGIIHSCWIGTSGCLIKMKEDGQPINIRSIDEIESIRKKNNTSINNKRLKPDELSSPQEHINKKRH